MFCRRLLALACMNAQSRQRLIGGSVKEALVPFEQPFQISELQLDKKLPIS